jgi:hypothetical protein
VHVYQPTRKASWLRATPSFAAQHKDWKRPFGSSYGRGTGRERRGTQALQQASCLSFSLTFISLIYETSEHTHPRRLLYEESCFDHKEGVTWWSQKCANFLWMHSRSAPDTEKRLTPALRGIIAETAATGLVRWFLLPSLGAAPLATPLTLPRRTPSSLGAPREAGH